VTGPACAAPIPDSTADQKHLTAVRDASDSHEARGVSARQSQPPAASASTRPATEAELPTWWPMRRQAEARLRGRPGRDRPRREPDRVAADSRSDSIVGRELARSRFPRIRDQHVRDPLSGRVGGFESGQAVRAPRACRFARRAPVRPRPVFRGSAVHVLVSEPSGPGGWSVR
jgi:hypothetical protein